MAVKPNYEFACEECGALVRAYRSPAQAAKRPPRFCSLGCLGAAQRGSANPSYSGGRHRMANGYLVVLEPDHPRADPRGYVYEHRLTMERRLGRHLRDGEVVHHRNGDKTDNAAENLALYASHSAHMKDHYQEGPLAHR